MILRWVGLTVRALFLLVADLHGTSIAPHSNCDRQKSDTNGQPDPQPGCGQVFAKSKLAQGIQAGMLRIGEIERRRGGRTKAVFDEGIEVIGAERDSFEEHDGNPGKNGPEKRSA